MDKFYSERFLIYMSFTSRRHTIFYWLGQLGRGSENKVAFIAAVITKQGRPQCLRFDMVKTFSWGEVENWAKSVLVANSETAPDGLPAFKALATHSSHERIVTGGGEKSVKIPAFRWVNPCSGNFKTWLSGTFHACDFDKYRYCGTA